MSPRLVIALALSSAFASAQVVLVEPGHTLTPLMNSMAPLHPSQNVVEMVQPIGDIESICVDPQSRDIYFQLIVPFGSPISNTTHIFRLSPALGGLVTPIVVNTGFGICERGADMQLDPWRGVLVTQDQNFGAGRLAWINPLTGMTGTWSLTTAPVFAASTFGMDFSVGAGGSIVPPGDILFTSDVAALGLHQCTFAGLGNVTHVPAALMPGGGDDVVIQPDGDWIFVGDFNVPITKYLPFPPFAAFPSALNLQAMFAAANLPFINGSRAAVCDATGAIYVTFSGGTGGTGIFRVDETLATATLVLTVGGPALNQGIHDLEVGPSSQGKGNSLYFTVHDYVTGAEEIWEMTAAGCCPIPSAALVVPDAFALNIPRSIAAFPPGNLPRLGNAAFAVQLDDPANACGIPPMIPTVALLNFWTGSAVIPFMGCTPWTPGELMLAAPVIVVGPPIPWAGPVVGAVHALPIPFDAALCGLPAYVQGLFLNPGPMPPNPVMFTWRLDMTLGS
ncbi:MAG: hypothetical protein U1F36_22000 [Planctomycetota bacterium]